MKKFNVGDDTIYLKDKTNSFYGKLLVVTETFGDYVKVRIVGKDCVWGPVHANDLLDARDMTALYPTGTKLTCIKGISSIKGISRFNVGDECHVDRVDRNLVYIKRDGENEPTSSFLTWQVFQYFETRTAQAPMDGENKKPEAKTFGESIIAYAKALVASLDEELQAAQLDLNAKQHALMDAEDRVAKARKLYNDASFEATLIEKRFAVAEKKKARRRG